MGYAFNNEALLVLALTHRSFCAENDDAESNERLEFLGDAVVGLAVTAFIYDAYPDLPEGQLAKLRASVVNTSTLAAVSSDIGLGNDLRLGRGEEMSGGRVKESILADAFEAVVGAVFVDSDWNQANDVVLECLGEHIVDGAQRPGRLDYKTRLQELTAQLELGSPVYRITGSGPDHDKNFVAVALVQGVARGEGSGTSKKRAEQAAASAAWSALNASYAGEMGESNA